MVSVVSRESTRGINHRPAAAFFSFFFLPQSERSSARCPGCVSHTHGCRAHKLSPVYVRTQGLWLRRVRFPSGPGHAVRLDSFFYSIHSLVVRLISSRYISLYLVFFFPVLFICAFLPDRYLKRYSSLPAPLFVALAVQGVVKCYFGGVSDTIYF